MMDPCRHMDNVQNTNAVYIDQFGAKGKTSIKTINPPGGQSHFSLGWGDPQNSQPEPPHYGRKRFQQPPPQSQPPYQPQPQYQPHYQPQPQSQPYNCQPGFGNVNKGNNYGGGVHTSVKVSNNPGGKSNIVFGTDEINYNDYRK